MNKYRVYFTIEGCVTLHAKNEDEAEKIVEDLNLSEWQKYDISLLGSAVNPILAEDF